MNYLIIGIIKILYMTITLPIIIAGCFVEIIMVMGGYEGGFKPWILEKLWNWMAES